MVVVIWQNEDVFAFHGGIPSSRPGTLNPRQRHPQRIPLLPKSL